VDGDDARAGDAFLLFVLNDAAERAVVTCAEAAAVTVKSVTTDKTSLINQVFILDS
jgi:hypothetical protein